jgi:hypothetical protein
MLQNRELLRYPSLADLLISLFQRLLPPLYQISLSAGQNRRFPPQINKASAACACCDFPSIVATILQYSIYAILLLHTGFGFLDVASVDVLFALSAIIVYVCCVSRCHVDLPRRTGYQRHQRF